MSLQALSIHRTLPSRGHPLHSYHPELEWYFGAADASLGLCSSWDAGPVTYAEPNIRPLALIRRIEAKFYRLPVRLQRVLELWYTQRQLTPGELLVREAHNAYNAVD